MLVGCAEAFVASLLLQACLQTLCFVFVFARRVIWSWDSIVSIVTRLWAGMSGVQIPPCPLCSGYSQGLMLSPYILRTLRLRMSGGTFLFLLCASLA